MKAQSLRDRDFTVEVDPDNAYEQGYELTCGGDHWHVLCAVGDFNIDAVCEFLSGSRDAMTDAERFEKPVSKPFSFKLFDGIRLALMNL